MTNKLVTLTLVDLDITQLMKIRQGFCAANCNRSNVDGAYRYELMELIDSMLDAGYSDVKSIRAPELTI